MRRRSGVTFACVLLVAAVATSSAYASASFGIERYALTATENDSSADTQAGSHPYELTAEAVLEPNAHNTSADEVKNLDFELPPGLVLDPNVVPNCTAGGFVGGTCPGAAAVGTVQMSVAGKIASATVYNLVPAPGEFARFGFTLEGVLVFAEVSVRTGSGYGMTLSIEGLPEVEIESVKLTLGGLSSSTLLTLPTSCASSPETTLRGESWGGERGSLSASFSQMTGCERLSFDPSLSVAPDAGEADTPSGYELDLNVPQPEDPEGLASAALMQAAVTLPEGVGISLSAADGLLACTEAQVGLGSTAPVACPNASKIGTVNIKTPLLPDPLQGAVFLAAPKENPFASLLAVYVVAEDPVSGVRVKLAGQIEANQLTGQLTIVLRELPQLPIGGLEVHFFGGERSLLSTPPACGLATSTSALTPWSTLPGGTSSSPAAAPSSSFEIDMGMDGTACSAVQPFDPTFQATSTMTGEADAYGSLSLLVSRTASEQRLGAIAIQAPPAVAQLFAGVPACGEPQASEGACPAASEVGTVAAQAGLGSYPADLNGEIYLTGPTLPAEGLNPSGAAQGLEIVLPVDPGPLELGTVVVRASAQIEPGTGRLSIATGRLPSFADGALLQFKALLLALDRDPLQISPDGCESLILTGTISSAQGSSVTIATEPFGSASSPCPPAPAAAATPGARDTSSSTATVSLASTAIAVEHGRTSVIKLTCKGTATCTGKLTLTVRTQGMFEKHGRSGKGRQRRSKTTTIATASFSISPGKTATIDVKLNAPGRALLSADHGRLSASLTILKSSPAPSQTHTESVQLVQRKAAQARKPGK
jgi:hypothetical protein